VKCALVGWEITPQNKKWRPDKKERGEKPSASGARRILTSRTRRRTAEKKRWRKEKTGCPIREAQEGEWAKHDRLKGGGRILFRNLPVGRKR